MWHDCCAIVWVNGTDRDAKKYHRIRHAYTWSSVPSMPFPSNFMTSLFLLRWSCYISNSFLGCHVWLNPLPYSHIKKNIYAVHIPQILRLTEAWCLGLDTIFSKTSVGRDPEPVVITERQKTNPDSFDICLNSLIHPQSHHFQVKIRFLILSSATALSGRRAGMGLKTKQ